MIVIGLAGGTAATRDAIAERLRATSGRALAVWAPKGVRLQVARSKTLARTLDCALGGGRSRILERAIGGDHATPAPVDTLIYSHVLTEAEADVIRENDGHVWHVFGPVSSEVVIRRGDQLVTEKDGGDRHWLDPIEAFSEVILAQGLGR